MKGSLRQRSPGSWELTIDTGRDALGKRQRKFVTVQGTKAQAQRKLREFLTSLDQGIALPTEKILLRDWLDRWMQERTPQWRQNTKERYQGVVQTRIPHLAQTSDAVNRQLPCFSSRYMNLLAVFQI